jgi:8-oxo-dGTP diphosphatase
VIYRRRTYRVEPARADAFNAFFNRHLLPLQRRHGARLVGRWITEDRTEIVAVWAYSDKAEYERIEDEIGADPGSAHAREARRALEPLFVETRQDWLLSTVDDAPSGDR